MISTTLGRPRVAVALPAIRAAKSAITTKGFIVFFIIAASLLPKRQRLGAEAITYREFCCTRLGRRKQHE